MVLILVPSLALELTCIDLNLLFPVGTTVHVGTIIPFIFHGSLMSCIYLFVRQRNIRPKHELIPVCADGTVLTVLIFPALISPRSLFYPVYYVLYICYMI